MDKASLQEQCDDLLEALVLLLDVYTKQTEAVNQTIQKFGCPPLPSPTYALKLVNKVLAKVKAEKE